MKAPHRKALVLNADYIPMHLVEWQRAMVLSLKNQSDPMDGYEVIEYYKNDFILATNHKRYPLPAVVRTPKYIKRHRHKVPFSRKNVFIRDRCTCCYCGTQYPPADLTYDHVVPRYEWKKKKYNGTPTKWENIVTSCYPCNRKKSNKTLKESGVSLLRKPIEPNTHGFILGLAPWHRMPQEWIQYLPPLYTAISNGKGN
jgi:5-methylcytosine-specific restriction endonuclease McrA